MQRSDRDGEGPAAAATATAAAKVVLCAAPFHRRQGGDLLRSPHLLVAQAQPHQ